VSTSDVFEPGLTGNESDGVSRHFPYVRNVPLDWDRDEYERWVPGTLAGSEWEVICVQCGDDEGPAQSQSDTVRNLRGPYSSKHRAEHVARRHAAEWGDLLWTPGAGVPPRGGGLLS